MTGQCSELAKKVSKSSFVWHILIFFLLPSTLDIAFVIQGNSISLGTLPSDTIHVRGTHRPTSLANSDMYSLLILCSKLPFSFVTGRIKYFSRRSAAESSTEETLS